MARAIAMFFNFLVIVIILKIFAPGLAGELVRLATTTVAILNDAVEEIASGDPLDLGDTPTVYP